MKEIFILTGEPSGDRLAYKVIKELKVINPNIEFLSVGGENLKSLGIKSIYNLNDITYSGFTKIFLNLFKINNKINETVEAVIKFNPDILFTVDSPDFTLRVSERVKKKEKNIKTIHFVAPQIWAWRKGRLKKLKKFIDHFFLLFHFEKKYFKEENISCDFVGHPLLDKNLATKIDLNQIIGKNKALISIFAGSRISEINILTPILINFIKLMANKYNDIIYVFHSTKKNIDLLQFYISKSGLTNCQVICDDKIKSHILEKSIFAVSKSGTVSLEICKAEVPSIILYKMGIINFFIIKLLVKIKFANIINISANKEIIPELLQNDCNAKNIYQKVNEFLDNPLKIKEQLTNIKLELNNFKTEKSSSVITSQYLNKFL